MAKEKKKLCKIYPLVCSWDGCSEVFQLVEQEYQTFSKHVESHVRECFEDEHQTDISYVCRWDGCPSSSMNSFSNLLRHVLLHSYHTKLKLAGDCERQRTNTNVCELDTSNKHLIPDTVFNIGRPWVCDWNGCVGKEFVCPDLFYRHLDKHTAYCQLIYEDECDKPAGAMCLWKECNSVFKNRHKLREHCRVHTLEKVISCPHCGSFFANNTKFLDHLTRQNAEAYENYQCSHCLKRCASERLLRDHMRHHVNHLKCSQCDMTCPNPSSLREHMKYRHNDERPFKCSQCSYCCKAPADLQRHNETHLEKIYNCPEEGCEFTTRTLHSMKRHTKERHKVSISARFACHICGRRYTRGTGLTSHLKTKHSFKWPSGFPRFRYREYEDGLFRLQMVRFESAELTQRLAAHSSTEQTSTEYSYDNGRYDSERYDDVQLTTDQTCKIITNHLGAAGDGLNDDDVVLVQSGGSLYVLPATSDTVNHEDGNIINNNFDQPLIILQDKCHTSLTARLPSDVHQLNKDNDVSTPPDDHSSFITISPSKFSAIQSNFENVSVTESTPPSTGTPPKGQLRRRRQQKNATSQDSKQASKKIALSSEYDQRLDISQTLLALQESASNIS